jgi:phosphinothricin acetyltransferase
MTDDLSIRRAELADAPALLEIYNHYILSTPITFDIEPKTLDQRRQWLDGFGKSGRYQCFVAVQAGRVVGWAASGRFRDRAAYDTTVETSVYVAPGLHRQGIGRRLYATLFDSLKTEDIQRAYGGVTQPNDASNGLHEAMGFRRAGMLDQVGRKFGRFWDVAVYLRPMR